jgi:hypothetical protein
LDEKNMQLITIVSKDNVTYVWYQRRRFLKKLTAYDMRGGQMMAINHIVSGYCWKNLHLPRDNKLQSLTTTVH